MLPTSLRARLVLYALQGAVATAPFALGVPSVQAQTPQQASIAVTAVASSSLLVFSWPLDATATGYTVSRRQSGTAAWGTAQSIAGGGAAVTWTDTLVTPGVRYEYWFRKTGGTAAQGIVTAAIDAPVTENRGKIVLLVDATKVAALGTRLDRLEQDLVGDGWSVLRHDVQPTATVVSVKALILADNAAYPGQLKSVFLLGHVPVPYSGVINPDGHPDHSGAWPADVFYGELNGNWTDVSVNTTTASRAENRNVPGDGKYDQSGLPSDVDLAVGRVDLANMPSFAQSEDVLLQQYLDKDHDYRHKVLVADQRAVIDDNFGYFGGEAFAASGWRNFTSLVGAANIVAADYFTTLNTTSGNGYVWAYGCGGGSYQSAGGIGSTADFALSNNRSVFSMLFGSYFGDWDSTDNFLRAPLCSGWTLSCVWAGRPHWSFHPMVLGETLGACARLSQNDTAAGGFGGRMVHVALMGDPTLRQHIIAPPSAVNVVDLWPQASVQWSASADAVAGYYVYRAASPQGPFVRITPTAIVGTQFLDAAPLAGSSTYMVRALRHETTLTGSYWNLSQGAFTTQSLPQLAANHTNFGAGCYAISDSFYASYATSSAANAALQNNSITMSPANGGYDVSSGGATFVIPGANAVVLALGDDDQIAVALSQSFAYPGGSTASLYVHSNGIIGTTALSMSPSSSAVPSITAMLAEATSAFYSWHDFDPTEPGSGSIVTEELGGTLYVTWNGVESKPLGIANPSTLQFQFELATGIVRCVWPSIETVGTGEWLVGWSPGGASVDAGNVDLGTALPLSVGNVNVAPLQLSASPAPIVTASNGVLLTYAIDEVPAWSPGNHVGLLIVSLAPNLAGSDLGSLGMPGCTQYLGSLDLFTFFVGTSSSVTSAFSLPAGFPVGVTVYAQALALMAPNSLPNGQNAFGGVTSNGVASFVNSH
ncbi:MAG: hypothetical protein IT456_21575 [Planctomycetes bacterium]|nr:hypothetical protein [Planctomycetota bacterium]